ncbi:SMP-30/gluconolactonase/LRE family protein [Candidatus Latescibacterota bacterium]
MKSLFTLSILCLCFSAGLSGTHADQIPSTFNIHHAELAPFSTVAEGVSVYDIPGESISVRRYRLEPGAQFSISHPGVGRLMTVVAGDGSIESQSLPEQSFQLCDTIFPESGATYVITAGDEGIGLVVVLNGQINGVSKVPAQHVAGTVIDYRTLHFIMPDNGTVVRNIPFGNGHISFVRLPPNDSAILKPVWSERVLLVLRGECTLNPSSLHLSEEDVAVIKPWAETGVTCGEDSCEVIEITTASNAEYETLLVDRQRKLHEIIDPSERPVLVTDGSVDNPPLKTTEGPSWMNGVLYFSNYDYSRRNGASPNGGVHAVFPDGSRRLITQDLMTCGTTPLLNGNLAACDIKDNRIIELAPDGAFIRTISQTFVDTPFGMPNDLVTDSRGGLYFTVPRLPKEGNKLPGSAVYYLQPGGDLLRVTGWNEFNIPNGCLVDADNKHFLLSCSREATIWRFDIGEDGTLSNKRPFAEVVPPDNPRDKDRRRGIADGMAMDTDGNVYVATCHGLDIYDSDGGYIGFMHLPVSPAHCVFGGEDLSTIYAVCRDRVYSVRLKKKGFEYPLR